MLSSILLFFCCRARKKTHFLFNLDTAPRAMRKQSIERGNWISLNHQLVPRVYTTTQPPIFFLLQLKPTWSVMEDPLIFLWPTVVSVQIWKQMLHRIPCRHARLLHIILLYRYVQKISMNHILGRLEIAYAASKFPIRINQTDHNDNMHL